MDRLWAPWRFNYLSKKKTKKCLFCSLRSHPAKKYVIFTTGHSLAVLNTFPYNNGHALVAPLRHVSDFTRLNIKERLDLLEALEKTKKLLDKALRPQGYNIGINMACDGGAGIVGHLHIHIVPRWRGDTNFMPVLGATKVISQSLDELYRRLKNA